MGHKGQIPMPSILTPSAVFKSQRDCSHSERREMKIVYFHPRKDSPCHQQLESVVKSSSQKKRWSGHGMSKQKSEYF
jgi:hypothetical protein